VIEAGRFHAEHAMMAVHAFDEEQAVTTISRASRPWPALTPARGRISAAQSSEERVSLLLCWIDGDRRHLEI
jgi:hypothetical protein